MTVRRNVIRTLTRQFAASALLAGLLCAAVAAANAQPSITEKRAEAQSISARLVQLDSAAHVAESRYHAATEKLRLVQQQLSQNKQALGVARGNLAAAQDALAERLVAIYTSQDDHSSLSVLLGAKSLDDLVTRLETINTVSDQNSALIQQVTSYQHSIVRHRNLLHRARNAIGGLVLARAAAKHSIEAKLAAEQRLYNSVRAEIAQMEASQRAAQLAAERRAQVQPPQAIIPGGYVGGTRYAAAAGIAMKYLGVPYRWGGADPSGFDCSGLVMYVYAQLGVSLPHYTVSQYNYANGVHVSLSQLQPGDVVFFYGLGHNGIYIGNGQFIHAPHTGSYVKIDSMNGYYASQFYGATRILG